MYVYEYHMRKRPRLLISQNIQDVFLLPLSFVPIMSAAAAGGIPDANPLCPREVDALGHLKTAHLRPQMFVRTGRQGRLDCRLQGRRNSLGNKRGVLLRGPVINVCKHYLLCLHMSQPLQGKPTRTCNGLFFPSPRVCPCDLSM